MGKRDITFRRLARRQLARTQPPCHLCGDPIDYTLTTLPNQHSTKCRRPECKGCSPHPRRFEADHIVPLDKGGTDDMTNVAASHRECNSRKRARLVSPVVRCAECGKHWPVQPLARDCEATHQEVPGGGRA